MSRKRPLSSRSVKKLAERERSAGLDPHDDAARWLEEHAPEPPPPTTSKSASKSKLLHQWRRRRQH